MNGVSLKTRFQGKKIAFSDYTRMHTEVHFGGRGPLPIPRWTSSDEKVRKVVGHRICITAGFPEVPEDLKDLRPLEEKYLRHIRASARSVPQLRKHLETVLRFGGPISFYTSLIYRRFRLAMNATELAEYYGITPENVRVSINRLCLIARAVFVDQNEHLPWHHSARNPNIPRLRIRYNSDRPTPKYHKVRFRVEEIRAAYLAGKNVREIAKQIGYPRGCGNNRVRNLLQQLGIYRKQETQCLSA